MEKRITGHTELIGLIAKPIRHSISPELHNAGFRLLNLDYAYLAFEIDQEAIDDTIKGFKSLQIRGFNVSMPYKTILMDYMDELSKEAKMIGSINTVVNDHGILKGYNTDGIGLMQALKNKDHDPKNKTIIIVGCGGAATAITIQAALDGAKKITIYNKKDAFYPNALKTKEKITKELDCIVEVKDLANLDELKKDMHKADIFINATNVGMKPNDGISYLPDESFFTPNTFVVDIIYNPKQTKLLELASKAGCQFMNGLDMLVYQGAAAFKLWTGVDMPVEQVKKEINL